MDTPIPPNDLQDERGLAQWIRGEGDIDEDEPTGIVSIQLDVPAGTTTGAYIKLMDAITYDEYVIEFYPAEHYQKEFTMNVGTYIILDGGLIDSDELYMTSESYFRVLENGYMSVKLPIRKYETVIRQGNGELKKAEVSMNEYYAMEAAREGIRNILGNNKNLSANETVDLSKTKDPEDIVVTTGSNEETETQNNSKIIYLIIGVTLLIIVLVLTISRLLYIKKNREDQE